MTDLERNPNRRNTQGELSRARQRKMKRDQQAGMIPPAEAESSRRQPSRSRASSSRGPSIRERLAETQIKLPADSIQSIQGKLSSTLGNLSRLVDENQPARKTSGNNNSPAPRNSRRKSEPRRGQSFYESTARAETQRKTHADQTFIPRKNRRQYDARAEAAPPVMVRGGMGGMAFGRVASSKLHKQRMPKRRFDVPLKAPGAEMRLPSIPLIYLGWRAISLIMVVMMAASLVLIWQAPVFQVRSVEAEGIKRLTVGDLNTVMGTLGSSVFTLDPNILEETLTQAFPELSKIAVRVGLPASVRVLVTERVPVIAWTQDGREVWLDAEGVSFPPRGNPEAALVRVEGHGTPPGLDTAAVTSSQQSLPPGMPVLGRPDFLNISLEPGMVSSILALGAKMPADTLLLYDSEHGLGWNDPNGWEVYFGAEDQDMQMKLNVYQTLVEHLQNEGIQPELISVEYVHAPYYRMER